MLSVFATNTKYNFLNYKIPLIYMTKKARFFTQNKIPAEKEDFRKNFLYLHRKSNRSEWPALQHTTVGAAENTAER